MAKTFPVTPGAIGTYEVALTAVFGLGGIRPELGFTVAVLDHIIKKTQSHCLEGGSPYRNWDSDGERSSPRIPIL
ncbi:lysylphosphatidylglycerol synthase domain-containing protein [Methanosarcina horonobensis]|uniref:lysylphosphatidylglycerol synthase domain-containing protein n=1 Tax=Methanosarcina horonobensis TaxID=418008 RepID=UPI0022B85965|nr:lysylphosphatidylglycerol synthase domain-containing protein [Methanosarcina horonobensis]